MLDIKNDGLIKFENRDGAAVVTEYGPDAEKLFGISKGDSLCLVNGRSVATMSFQDILDSVQKCELGLVALRFRRTKAEIPPTKVRPLLLSLDRNTSSSPNRSRVMSFALVRTGRGIQQEEEIEDERRERASSPDQGRRREDRGKRPSPRQVKM